MKYGIGLDIGIGSVGYSVVGLNEAEEPHGIIRLGSRIFDVAEHSNGASLALPRREARSARRRLRRKKHRKERIKSLILHMHVLTPEQFSVLYQGKKMEDIYFLRVKALDEPVSAEEFTRILLHLSQRRGFRSNRKADTSDKENGKLLTAMNNNIHLMHQKGYRTVGEMFFKDDAYAQCKRNKGENYLATVQRDMIEDEAHQIFQAQRNYHSPFATPELEDAYISILMSQRAFDEGPGGSSPYGGNQIEKMVGLCTLETSPPQFRAARACYSFEYFRLLQTLNNIRIQYAGKDRPLTQQERDTIITLMHKSPSVTYAKLRTTLGLSDAEVFNLVHYYGERNEAEKKTKLNDLCSYHVIRKALDKVVKGRISALSRDQLNEIGRVLTCYKTDSKIKDCLEKIGLETADIEALLTCPGFSKFGHISVLACDKLIPYLEKGMKYSEACDAAGYHFKGHADSSKSVLLPAVTDEMDEITSPVVRRAVAQTIKVVNAIIREQGESPVYINVELAREMAKNHDERVKLDKQILENTTQNKARVTRIKEYGIAKPSGLDIVKLKLFEEQNGVCAYSQQQMSIEHLFENGYAEIDHIVPYSISFDDSYSNKVLVLAEENRQKSNRLPLQYLQGERRDKFIVWTENNVHSNRKRQNLLKEEITEENRKQFRERNLQDTKHMARFLYNYLTDYLEFAPSSSGKKRRVTAVNGAITSMMRKRWGLTKIRADGDLHHALDATVIACTTQKIINDVSQHYAREETEYSVSEGGSYFVNAKTGEAFPMPWPHFRDELMARLSKQPDKAIKLLKLPFYSDTPANAIAPVFVSRMPRRKVSGAAHKATIKSAKHLEDGFVTLKQPLTALKLDSAGEIKDYFNPQSDILLYNALKERLLQNGGNGAKAFSDNFYKPKKDGSMGPLVKKVKLCEKTNVNVSVHGGTGVANNDNMVRIDVFLVPGDGYYFVPIYVKDTVLRALPNKAAVAHKPYTEWKEMKDDDFLFSVYPNDLLKVIHKSSLVFSSAQEDSTLPPTLGGTEAPVYFVSANISTASISVINHDDYYRIKGLGIKTLEKLEKYQVDVLGNVTLVKREKRQAFQ